MSLGIRLKQARLKKKLTQEELAEIVGIKQQAVQRIEAGKVKSTSYVVQLAQALDVTPEWLALGEETAETGLADGHTSSNASTQQCTQAPLLKWHDLELVKQLPLSSGEYSKLPLLDRVCNKCFALQIKDNSMTATNPGQPSFLPNDYIIIDTSLESKNGDFVIAKLDNSSQMTFRQLVSSPTGNQLSPLNKQYNNILVNDNVEIIGTVIFRYSNLAQTAIN